MATVLTSTLPPMALYVLTLCPDFLVHFLKFVDFCRNFHAVFRGHRKVSTQLGVIQVSVACVRTGRRCGITFEIGGKFGLRTKTIRCSCAVWTLFSAPYGSWCSGLGSAVSVVTWAMWAVPAPASGAVPPT